MSRGLGKVDGSMTQAARIAAFFIAVFVRRGEWLNGQVKAVHPAGAVFLCTWMLLFVSPPRVLFRAGGLPGLPRRQDHAGRSGPQHRRRRRQVQRPAFTAACNATPATPTSRTTRIPTTSPRSTARRATPTQSAALTGSVHSSSKEHPCTSCHGNAHEIFPKTDARSAVYPLNVPKTCGQCHSNDGMASKTWTAQRLSATTSIRSTASRSARKACWSQPTARAATDRMSILSHNDPKSPTYQGEHPQHLRHMPRQDQRRLQGRSRTATPFARGI